MLSQYLEHRPARKTGSHFSADALEGQRRLNCFIDSSWDKLKTDIVASLMCWRPQERIVIAISPPLLGQGQGHQSRLSGVLIGVHIEPDPAIGADAAPATGEECLPEQVPLDVEGTEPEAVGHRYPVNGRRRSLREISAVLAEAGHVTSTGNPYAAAAVAKMIGA